MRAPYALLLVGISLSCGDDAHKGTISHGPPATAATSAGAKEEPKIRLIYGPGSPLATFPTATAMRNRLQSLGISKRQIQIGGVQIHVDVPKSKVDAVKKRLEGGRIDVYAVDTTANPFVATATNLGKAHKLGFTVKSETMRSGDGTAMTLRYLVGPMSKKKVLLKLLKQQKVSATPLLGHVYEGTQAVKIRSFYVHPDRTLRGERLKTATVKKADDGVKLELTFSGAGKSFLRWESKRHTRFVVQLDDWVESTVQPKERITDGKLTITLNWPSDQANKTVAKLEKEQGMSHLVKLLKERPL